jgi:hypothetical protein
MKVARRGNSAQPLLLTHIAAMDGVSLCGADEKLTAFLELESAILGVRKCAGRS